MNVCDNQLVYFKHQVVKKYIIKLLEVLKQIIKKA